MKRKTIFIIIGDAGNGKTTFGRLVVQNSGMLTDPTSAVIDADEKQGLVKLSKSVKRHPLRNREDYRTIESLMLDKTRLWIDTPGTSQVFIADSIKNPLMFARYGIHIVPVLLIGNRGSSMEVAKEWLELMGSLPTIYVIHNPKRTITKQEKTDFTNALQKMKGTAKLVIMHMPPLDADIAKELEKIGCPLDKIINGKIDPAQSEILSHFSTMIDVETWKQATDEEFGDFYNLVRSAGPSTASIAVGSEDLPTTSETALN